MVSTRHCNRLLDLDREAGWVRVEAGITLRALNARLATWGLALEHPGDFDAMALGRALATGAHGSGARWGGLAAQVLDLDLVTVDGELLHCSAREEPDVFAAARCSLGTLGMVARVTLRAVPAFNVAARESVVSLDGLELESEIAGSDYFSCAWLPHTRLVTVRRRYRSAAPPGGFGHLAWARTYGVTSAALAVRARGGRHWPAVVPLSARVRRGPLPASTDRSYRVLCTPRWVRFVESEWALPRPALEGALRQLAAWHEQSWAERRRPAVAFPVEVTTAAADDVWLSGAYGRDNGYVAVRAATPADGEEWFAAVAAIMGPLGGRPRLGGVVGLGAPDLAPRFPRWADWHVARRRVDPQGRFATPETDRLLGPVR